MLQCPNLHREIARQVERGGTTCTSCPELVDGGHSSMLHPMYECHLATCEYANEVVSQMLGLLSQLSALCDAFNDDSHESWP
jgi:hypothetical protein